jgi:hypothetical protein
MYDKSEPEAPGSGRASARPLDLNFAMLVSIRTPDLIGTDHPEADHRGPKLQWRALLSGQPTFRIHSLVIRRLGISECR